MLTRTLIIALCLLSPLSAQDEGMDMYGMGESQSSQGYDIDFPGGTLELLFDLIHEQNQKTTNVIIAEDVKEMDIPPIHLKNIDMGALAGSLGQMMPELLAKSQGDIVTYYQHKPEVGVQIYNIRHLVDQLDESTRYSLEDIATSIQTAWEMCPHSYKPTHYETAMMHPTNRSLPT
jgi:hypothetical protein